MTDRAQVLAYRALGHHLDDRLPRCDLATAVGAVGIRDMQGSGSLALHARVENIAGDEISVGLADGTLLEVISARGTQTVIPASDVAVFTVGTLPEDEESLRTRLRPFLPVLDRSGHSAMHALELAKGVARDALSNGPLDIGGLSGALTRALPEFSPVCRGRCTVEHIEQGLFDLVGASGVWRQDRADGSRVFVAMEEPTDREVARIELLRRYLSCYGPSKPADFAEWCGVGVADARRSFQETELAEVARGRFLPHDRLESLEAPPAPHGIRILPPRDPYLLDRDRATLVPERELQRRIWRSTPTDGVVLGDGVPVATWRPKKTGHHLVFTVEAFTSLAMPHRAALERETEAVAAIRGCTTEIHYA